MSWMTSPLLPLIFRYLSLICSRRVIDDVIPASPLYLPPPPLLGPITSYRVPDKNGSKH